MDILDFFWTFYLNHLSPLWGYFFLIFLSIHFNVIKSFNVDICVRRTKINNK